MMESKKDVLKLIGVNILESIIALVFLLAFVGAGVITSFCLDSTMFGDVAVVVALFAGLIALVLKVKVEDKFEGDL